MNALKCKRDELDILDLKVISRALAEFRHAARAFSSHCGWPRKSTSRVIQAARITSARLRRHATLSDS